MGVYRMYMGAYKMYLGVYKMYMGVYKVFMGVCKIYTGGSIQKKGHNGKLNVKSCIWLRMGGGKDKIVTRPFTNPTPFHFFKRSKNNAATIQIGLFQRYQNTLCCSFKILHKHCFQSLSLLQNSWGTRKKNSKGVEPIKVWLLMQMQLYH